MNAAGSEHVDEASTFNETAPRSTEPLLEPPIPAPALPPFPPPLVPPAGPPAVPAAPPVAVEPAEVPLDPPFELPAGPPPLVPLDPLVPPEVPSSSALSSLLQPLTRSSESSAGNSFHMREAL